MKWSDFLTERAAGDFRHTDSSKDAQKAAHSQGFEMSNPKSSTSQPSHVRFSVEPRGKRGKDAREKAGLDAKIRKNSPNEQGQQNHLGMGKKSKKMEKHGRDSLVDAMKQQWKLQGKTKAGSSRKPEDVEQKKVDAAGNKDKKNAERSKGFSKVDRPDKAARKQKARAAMKEMVAWLESEYDMSMNEALNTTMWFVEQEYQEKFSYELLEGYVTVS